jgi:hypothetical protein
VEIGAPVLAAVASPRRREILRLVWERELAAGAIHAAMPDVTFGAVSLQRMWSDALWRLKLQAELEETRRGPRAGRRGARKRKGRRS